MARYEAGEASTVREPIACAELIVSIVDEFQPVAEIKGIELRSETAGPSLSALGDPHEIRRAIINTGVKVPESSVIGFDLDADRAKGYHVTEGGIVVVA